MKSAFPSKSSINPPEFSTLETDTEKYLNEQAVINLPKSESTIYFQLSISKVNGWFAGLSTGYKDFPSHGTCSQWQLCMSYYHPITLWSSTLKWKSICFHTHTKSQQHFLRWDLLSLSCRQARNGNCETPPSYPQKQSALKDQHTHRGSNCTIC